MSFKKEINMSNQYIVDNFNKGVGRVTDGNETIYIAQRRVYLNAAVQNVDGYNAIIKPVSNQANQVASTAMLQDAPVEETPKKASKKVEA